MTGARARLRLYLWKPDMSGLAAALAAFGIAATLLVQLPDATLHPDARRVLLYLALFSVAVGLVLCGRALANRLPLADVEHEWNREYEDLRNNTTAFCREMDAAYDSVRATFDADFSQMPTNWRAFTEYVPIPKVDGRPLWTWEERLASHHSAHVRQFFALAKIVETSPSVTGYRRHAVRTYDRFWRLREANVPGFRNWMDQQEVRAGAEPLVLILAYLEVAAACRVRISRSPAHLGFWELAESWHSETLALPRNSR